MASPQSLEQLPAVDGEALRYAVLDDELLIWHLRAGRTMLHRVPLLRRELHALVRNAVAAFRQRESQSDGLRRLGDLLLAPIADTALPARLLIVPDDVLFAVPFAALTAPGRRAPLIATTELRLAPSLASAGSIAVRRPPPRSLTTLWVADARGEDLPPLPAARRAAVDAGATYARIGRAILLLGDDANVAALLAALPRANLAEIDVHSTSTGSFLGSTLHLAAEGEGGSALAAEQIAALDLRQLRVAVLATCNSSNRDYHGSEGIGGLQWAFLAAGAQAVLSTLWEVDDAEAARFTAALHRDLLAGATLSAAARRAALDSMARGSNAWAAFVHYGEDPTVREH